MQVRVKLVLIRVAVSMRPEDPGKAMPEAEAVVGRLDWSPTRLLILASSEQMVEALSFPALQGWFGWKHLPLPGHRFRLANHFFTDGLALPTGGSSSLTVSSVKGVTISANPFTFPDTAINTSEAVPVVISGTNIPPNTTRKLSIFSETGADQSISFTLTGTFASTTATVNVTYPAGGSRGFGRVTSTTP